MKKETFLTQPSSWVMEIILVYQIFFRVTEDLQEKKKQLQIALEEKQKQEDQLKLCKQQGEEFIRR